MTLRRPAALPDFATDPDPANLVEPVESVRQGGFVIGTTPPAPWVNWLFGQIGACLAYLFGPSTSAWTRYSFALGEIPGAVDADDVTTEVGVTVPLRRLLLVTSPLSFAPKLYASVRGQVWTAIAAGEPVEVAEPTAVHFTGTRWIVGCTTNGAIFWTYPDGDSLGASAISDANPWTASSVPAAMSAIRAIDSDGADVAAVTADAILVSTDAGVTFAEASYAGDPVTGSFTDVHFEGQAWLAVTDDGEILRATTIGGAWTREASTLGSTATGWALRDDGDIVVAFQQFGTTTDIFVSADHGVAWTDIELPTSENDRFKRIADMRYFDGAWFLSGANSPYLSSSNDVTDPLSWVSLKVPFYSDTAQGAGLLAMCEGALFQFYGPAGDAPYVLIGNRAQEMAPGAWQPTGAPPMLHDAAYIRGRFVDDAAPANGDTLVWSAAGDQYAPGSAGGRARARATAIDTVTTAADEVILVTSTATDRAIGLCAPGSTFGTPTCMQRFTVIDGGGNASGHPITLTPVSGLINGAATAVINTDRGAITVLTDGANYYIESALS